MTRQQLPVWADTEVPESELDPQGVSRRGLIRGAGLLGAGFAAGSTMTAPAAADPAYSKDDFVYLVGDHHVHSRYSHDAKYDFGQLAQRGAQFGLDWIAFTEHSNFGHADTGVDAEHAEVVKARAENPRMLIFQGLEWYIPAAEHGTVLVAPGANDVELLRTFERTYDGKLTNRADSTPGNEAHAVAALRWLAAQKRSGYVDDVVVLANHPTRLGIDSPHELRAWRDAAAGIVVGMEGAPGSQGDADPAWVAYRGSPRAQRGEYQNAPRPDSFPGYPADAYRTYGGFDWVTATVGGLWDAMLATGPNYHGIVPRLAHLDLIHGRVTGPAADRDSWRAPDTKVVASEEPRHDTVRFSLGRVTESCYVRLRGSDGNRNGPGYLGASVDPAGPLRHPDNDGDPWLDTWLYTNPVFIDVR